MSAPTQFLAFNVGDPEMKYGPFPGPVSAFSWAVEVARMSPSGVRIEPLWQPYTEFQRAERELAHQRLIGSWEEFVKSSRETQDNAGDPVTASAH